MSQYLGITRPRNLSLLSGKRFHNHSFQKFIGHYFVITGDFLFSRNCTAPLRKSEFFPLIRIFPLLSLSFLLFYFFFVSLRTFWVRRSAPLEKSSAPQEGGWRGSSRKCLSILKKKKITTPSIVFVKEIIKVCFCLVRNYAHESCAGPAKRRMKRVPHLSLSSVFINVGRGKHSVSHPANASCAEPAGANSFIYYIARLDSEKPDHPVMARRGERRIKRNL